MLDEVNAELVEVEKALVAAHEASPGPNRTAIDQVVRAVRHLKNAVEKLAGEVQGVEDGDFS